MKKILIVCFIVLCFAVSINASDRVVYTIERHCSGWGMGFGMTGFSSSECEDCIYRLYENGKVEEVECYPANGDFKTERILKFWDEEIRNFPETNQ